MTEALIFSIVEKFVGVAKIWYPIVQGWPLPPHTTPWLWACGISHQNIVGQIACDQIKAYRIYQNFIFENSVKISSRVGRLKHFSFRGERVVFRAAKSLMIEKLRPNTCRVRS